MKHLIVLLITMMITVGCGTGKPTSAPSSVNEVSVTCGEYAGRGTVLAVREDGVYVSTAYHIIRSGTEISTGTAPSVAYKDGRTVSSEIVYQEEDGDVCILRAKEKDAFPIKGKGVFSEEESEPPSKGDPLYFFDETGEMHSGAVTDTGADIPGVGTDLLRFDGTVKEGLSGCGVYAGDGSFTGMLIAGDENYDGAAVKAEKIYSAFAALNE